MNVQRTTTAQARLNDRRTAQQMYDSGVNTWDIAYHLGQSINNVRAQIGDIGKLCSECHAREADYLSRKCVPCQQESRLRTLTKPGRHNSLHVESVPSGDHDSGPVQRKASL